MKETVDKPLKKTSIKPESDYGEDIVAYRNSIMIEMERQSSLEFAKEEELKMERWKWPGK